METSNSWLIPISSRWMMKRRSSEWTEEENKRFESGLAIYDERTPNRWFKVANLIPGKSVYDVMNQYNELAADVSDIEAGLVPIPQDFELVQDHHRRRQATLIRNRGSSRCCDQERKKGVPWTEEEHRRFLMGLEKHGKGNWRNISRNFVISKTPTQVASHAQKYYLRQLAGGKDKRRPSIHDITTVNLTAIDLSLDNNKLLSSEKSNDEAALMAFGSSYSSSLDSLSRGRYGIDIANASSQQLHLHLQSTTTYQIWG
ncbi:hypothetical protein K7X08_023162 [Anisodus acutangulus]|uniref:Uncharacterized protein n=1 Tax=Anisodus acutangulus TaxID=402998 RepID=A0A9Q1R2E5_9SOLA|nr:hypothetical protein K7X08_023162 [Anisodus acutangulus]